MLSELQRERVHKLEQAVLVSPVPVSGVPILSLVLFYGQNAHYSESVTYIQLQQE